jgi:hypothetical protein
MARLRRHRPTPAMVVACIALTVALGGTGYAATVLPRNSVGPAQLQNNAVTSLKVKNFSLSRQDFKPGQLAAGPQGPAGAAGPAGPAGPAARWALVSGDGTIIAQSSGITPTAKTSTGVYILDFGTTVSGKLIIVSSANAADVGDRGTVSAGPCGGPPGGSICPTGNDTNHVRVITRKAGDNTAEDHPFYIAVIG